MANKIKINRPFIYKAYQVNDFNNCLHSLKDAKFLFKSECHYYVEKFILDFINNNLQTLLNDDNCKFVLIKVYDKDILANDDEIVNKYEYLIDDEKIHIR